MIHHVFTKPNRPYIELNPLRNRFQNRLTSISRLVQAPSRLITFQEHTSVDCLCNQSTPQTLCWTVSRLTVLSVDCSLCQTCTALSVRPPVDWSAEPFD